MILFVCTGNTCRSPMAKTLMNRKIQELGVDISVESCGIFVSETAATKGAINAMKELGLELLDHFPTQVSPAHIEEATLVLTMTTSHKDTLVSNMPEAVSKTYTVYEYATKTKKDVNDPYGGSDFEYLKTARELEELISKMKIPI